jgi:hypothetical protein
MKAFAAALILIASTAANHATAEMTITALGRQASKQLTLESSAKTVESKEGAAAALCDLYVVLRSDPRFASSGRLRGEAAKVRRRLLTLARRREVQLIRNGMIRPVGLSRRVESAIEASLSGGDPSKLFTDGPVESADAAAGPIADDGWGLVELIERVIAPDLWESRGGAGTIHYFAMRRILVIRATSDVHQQVEELLMALR